MLVIVDGADASHALLEHVNTLNNPPGRSRVVRRSELVIDGNRARRRLISLARWAFPDVWAAFAGSWPTSVAVLTRWPDLRALA